MRGWDILIEPKQIRRVVLCLDPSETIPRRAWVCRTGAHLTLVRQESYVSARVAGLNGLREFVDPRGAHASILGALIERRDVDEHRPRSVSIRGCIRRHACGCATEGSQLRDTHSGIRAGEVFEDRLCCAFIDRV